MQEIIVPLPKSPHSKGRIGQKEDQDWYRSLKKAVRLSIKRGAGILVLTAFKAIDSESEADICARVLLELGCTEVSNKDELGERTFLVVRECDETIGQVEWVCDVVIEEWGMKPILISTFGHYLRVQWLTLTNFYPNGSFEHKIAYGIPRPMEFVTDIILTFVFPVIDLLGGRDWFKTLVHGKREKGEHI